MQGIKKFTVIAATVALSAATLAACGGSSSESSTPSNAVPSVEKDDALASQVPDSIASDGKILVGSDASYAPAEYIDADGNIVGFDVDLFRAVGQKLGLDVEFQNAPFGSIITGVNSGKYEVGVSSFTINQEREAQATMVSYFDVGTQWFVATGNPANISIDDACGAHVAVQKDTVQVPDVQAKSDACTQAGKDAITIDQYQLQDQATASVASGKDDAGLADYPVGVYAVQQSNGQVELLGDPYGAAPYGYVLPPDQADFGQVVADAVQALIDDGTYDTILKNWSVEKGAITKSEVNPAVSS